MAIRYNICSKWLLYSRMFMIITKINTYIQMKIYIIINFYNAFDNGVGWLKEYLLCLHKDIIIIIPA